LGRALKFGNVNPLTGSVSGAIGGCTPAPQEINPLQEVADLVASNAECDIEDLGTGYCSAERRIQARTSLFNETEVEGSGVGNRLDVGCGAKIRVGSWDRGKLTRRRCGKRLVELGTEIGIGLTTVPDVPTRVRR
jgi:hypothetical protein